MGMRDIDPGGLGDVLDLARPTWDDVRDRD